MKNKRDKRKDDVSFYKKRIQTNLECKRGRAREFFFESTVSGVFERAGLPKFVCLKRDGAAASRVRRTVKGRRRGLKSDNRAPREEKWRARAIEEKKKKQVGADLSAEMGLPGGGNSYCCRTEDARRTERTIHRGVYLYIADPLLQFILRAAVYISMYIKPGAGIRMTGRPTDRPSGGPPGARCGEGAEGAEGEAEPRASSLHSRRAICITVRDRHHHSRR